MNVESAWDQGFTGKGVVITIIDDGLEWTHREFKCSFDPEASDGLDEIYPSSNPDYAHDNDSFHSGTALAGIIGAAPNNSFCGVGIAHGAKVGSIVAADKELSDPYDAVALSYNPDHVDIYCGVLGAPDDGKAFDGPGNQTQGVLESGVKTGRGGKGSIYVWGSGGGSQTYDDCNADGFVSSVYTIAVGSVTADGRLSAFGEQCSALLAVTFNGALVSPNLHDSCEVAFPPDSFANGVHSNWLWT